MPTPGSSARGSLRSASTTFLVACGKAVDADPSLRLGQALRRHDGEWRAVRQSFGRLAVRRETDKEQEVQVLYGEDLASHAGPAPCTEAPAASMTRWMPPAFAGAGLVTGIGNTKVNWILDADIRSFFDMVSQEWLIRFGEHRIGPRSGPMQQEAVSALGDRRIIRLIQKWLKAGSLEDEVVTISERGTGQGSVISPPAFAGAGYCLRISTCTTPSTSGPIAGDVSL
jgi:hypothetical protein